MDLLRAHADGLLMGMNTLREEQRSRGPESRGIVFRVADPRLRELRKKLGKGRERNIFVTKAADLDLSRHKVFDGDVVDAALSACTRKADTRKLPSSLPATRKRSIFRARLPGCERSSECNISCAKEGPHFTATWHAPI